MNYMNLSKTMSYALRHNPQEFNLILDKQGWTNINSLLEGIRNNSDKYSTITIDNISKIVSEDKKKRYEINGDKIRAVYGHSISKKIEKQVSKPPKILYHGTTPEFYNKIKDEGLKHMQRQYVHLSLDIDTAIIVAKRRTNTPVLLSVDCEKASNNGINFYKESTGIWLSDDIPSKYLSKKVIK